jgi:hypothetical protein
MKLGKSHKKCNHKKISLMIFLNMFLVAKERENSENKKGSIGPATCARGRGGGATTMLAVPPPSPRPQVSPTYICRYRSHIAKIHFFFSCLIYYTKKVLIYYQCCSFASSI